MLDQSKVFDVLERNGVTFFVGVPDSYLNGFCNHALAHCGPRNVIAANEGNAIAIAAGHWFATGEIPLVYMQNSGLGNAVNPLASLADVRVYAVPMLLLVGWRGQGDSEPNHPQHTLQGEMTPKMLETMHIPYAVLEDDDVPAVSFVSFCKEMLDRYEHDERITMISGFNVEEQTDDAEGDYFFTTNFSIWGWASWRRVVDQWDEHYTWLDDPIAVRQLEE